MDLMIRLPEDLEQPLKQEAQRRGVAPEEVVTAALRERLPTDRQAAWRELRRMWDEEDATDDPAEIARRQAEWEELKTALDEDRLSYRKLFSKD